MTAGPRSGWLRPTLFVVATAVIVAVIALAGSETRLRLEHDLLTRLRRSQPVVTVDIEGVGEIPSGGTDDHVRHAVEVDVPPTPDGLTEALTDRLTAPGPDRTPVDHREHTRFARAAAGAGASNDEIDDGVTVDVADRGHGPTVLVGDEGAFTVAQESLRLD